MNLPQSVIHSTLRVVYPLLVQAVTYAYTLPQWIFRQKVIKIQTVNVQTKSY